MDACPGRVGHGVVEVRRGQRADSGLSYGHDRGPMQSWCQARCRYNLRNLVSPLNPGVGVAARSRVESSASEPQLGHPLPSEMTKAPARFERPRVYHTQGGSVALAPMESAARDRFQNVPTAHACERPVGPRHRIQRVPLHAAAREDDPQAAHRPNDSDPIELTGAMTLEAVPLGMASILPLAYRRSAP